MNNINFILSGLVAYKCWKGKLPSKPVYASGVRLLLAASVSGVVIAARAGLRRCAACAATLCGVLCRDAGPEMAHRCLGIQVFRQWRDKEAIPQRYTGSL